MIHYHEKCLFYRQIYSNTHIGNVMAAKSVIVFFYTKQIFDVLIELPQGCSNKNSQCACWCKITKLVLQTSHLPKQTFTNFFSKVPSKFYIMCQ